MPGTTDSTAFGARDLDAPHFLGRALDFEPADGVAGALETEFPGPPRIDEGAPLLISAEFEALRRLVGLLRWDADPSV